MSSEWRRLSLREANVRLIDCEHRTPPAAAEGYPYVAIPQIKNGRVDTSTARRISRSDFLEWTRKALPQVNDVILSRRCNPGETAVVPAGLQCALGQNLVLLRADGALIHPPFLRWLVRSPDWWEQIAKFMNVGAVFDSLRCADIPNFILPIPPLPEQQGIAHLLGALDDKIDLNRRMNETLEAMARAIFKDWFVDFGPVRAKAEGCIPPTLSPDIAALFPDTLDDEDKPLGWQQVPLLSVADLLSGGTPKTDVLAYWNGDVAWASAKDVSQCGEMFLIQSERQITDKGLAESAAKMIDRFSTVVVARGATTGRYCMLGRDMAMNQTCYALRSKTGHHFWLNCAFGQLVSDLVHAAHGSVFDTITTRTMEGAVVVAPGPQLIAQFEATSRPLFERILSNLEENQTLAALRDILLPKLMSGEIRLKDAETAVGEVA